MSTPTEGIALSAQTPRMFEVSAINRTPTQAVALGRLESFDAFRPMAAFATILVHSSISPESQRWTPLSRFSLPFFVLAAIYFLFRGERKHPEVSFGQQLRQRAWRLLLPFAAWNVIYALLRVAKHLVLVHEGPPKFDWNAIWVGSAHHLWFLPYLLVTTVWVLTVIRTMRRMPLLRIPAAILLLALGAAMCFTPEPAICHLPTYNSYFLDRAFVMLPSICWGTALGLLLMEDDGTFETDWRIGSFGLVLILLGTIVVGAAVPHSGPYRMARHFSGMGVLLVALMPVRGEIINRLAVLGRCSYGIFLSHVAFVEGIQAVAARLGAKISWPLDLTVFMLSCIGATALTLLLRRSSKTRWLAG